MTTGLRASPGVPPRLRPGSSVPRSPSGIVGARSSPDGPHEQPRVIRVTGPRAGFESASASTSSRARHAPPASPVERMPLRVRITLREHLASCASRSASISSRTHAAPRAPRVVRITLREHSVVRITLREHLASCASCSAQPRCLCKPGHGRKMTRTASEAVAAARCSSRDDRRRWTSGAPTMPLDGRGADARDAGSEGPAAHAQAHSPMSARTGPGILDASSRTSAEHVRGEAPARARDPVASAPRPEYTMPPAPRCPDTRHCSLPEPAATHTRTRCHRAVRTRVTARCPNTPRRTPGHAATALSEHASLLAARTRRGAHQDPLPGAVRTQNCTTRQPHE